jgi:hypothetical protein
MAKTVAKEAARSMLPIILAIAAGLALVVWLAVR